MRFLDGVLEFSNDGGATWTTAINADGILANACLSATSPAVTTSSRTHPSSWLTSSAQARRCGTVTGDWDDKLAGSVLIDDTTGDLKMTSVTY